MGRIMVDKFFIALAIVVVMWVIGDSIVRIIRASKSPGGKVKERIDELESDLADMEQDLMDARKRIEVLEKIVTDGREDLRRQIDDLG